jgi:glyoxylase-like metal-dependent hydrolase (beta-lactamase superfamily II)
MTSTAVEAYKTQSGVRIYRLPLEVFPGFWGFAHLVISQEDCWLIDVGSGLESSNTRLEQGLEAVRMAHGESIEWRSIRSVLITHGHIDHFGGLSYVRSRTDARIGIHELDRRVLTNYEERLIESTHALAAFLSRSGLEVEQQREMLELYHVHKSLFHSVPVDFVLRQSTTRLGPLTAHHMPGHCPGLVMLEVGDILLTADHILSDISPHQSPESLSAYTGLGHYLDSLKASEPLAARARLALGGHQQPMLDALGRVSAIRQMHVERLAQVVDILHQPSTTAEVAFRLFPRAYGYNVLLALEEVAAHIEFLWLRGYLRVTNCEEWEKGDGMPLWYVAPPELEPPSLAGPAPG